jgi:S-adenosylmethionine:tRNA ribosyltransferase-isomerase
MKKLSEIFIQEFNYDLPNEKIAVHPLPQRDSSKLLIYEDGKITLSIFKSLIDYLPPNSSLILNNTRVIEARIFFKKNTGGIIEIFCLEPENLHIEEALRTHKKVQWNCLIGGASKWRRGEVLEKLIDMGGVQILLNARYINKNEDSFIIEFSWHPSSYQFAEILHAVGLIPLPPYIKRKVEDSDAERYQTIFAKKQGSVASPTAALHFTESVFKNLKEKGISQSYCM